jgi:hypothetical protein
MAGARALFAPYVKWNHDVAKSAGTSENPRTAQTALASDSPNVFLFCKSVGPSISASRLLAVLRTVKGEIAVGAMCYRRRTASEILCVNRIRPANAP